MARSGDCLLNVCRRNSFSSSSADNPLGTRSSADSVCSSRTEINAKISLKFDDLIEFPTQLKIVVGYYGVQVEVVLGKVIARLGRIVFKEFEANPIAISGIYL